MSPAALRRHHWNIAAAAAVLLIYAAVLASMPAHVFWSPDEGGKFLEMQSMHWHDGLTYTVPYASQRIDPHFDFYPRLSASDSGAFPYPSATAQGSVRFYWPIWFPLLSRIMLQALGLRGIYLIPLLSGWLITLLSGRIVHAFTPRLAPLAILLVGLATPVCFYSQCFWEHTLTSLLGLLAVAILVARRSGSVATPLAMVPPLVAATMLRIEMVAFAVAAVLMWGLTGLVTRGWVSSEVEATSASSSRDARRSGQLPRWAAYLLLVCLAAGALTMIVLTAPLRQQRFIATLPTHLGLFVLKMPHLPRSVASLLINTGLNEGPIVAPAWVAVACVAVGLCFVAPFIAAARTEAAILIPALVATLVFSTSVVLLSRGYRALHGIFPVAPFLVIWLYALPDAWRRRDAKLLTLAGFAVVYLLIGCAAIFIFHTDTQGRLTTGLEWGQRYLLTLYPILTILSLVAFSAYWHSTRPVRLRNAFAVLVSAMVVIGVQQEVRGIAMLRFNRVKFADWDRWLRSDGPIVTDLWWLPATLAPLFVSKEMSYVARPAHLARWVPLAAAHGVTDFTFASLGPVDDAALSDVAARRVAQDSCVVSGLSLTRFRLAAAAPASSPQ